MKRYFKKALLVISMVSLTFALNSCNETEDKVETQSLSVSSPEKKNTVIFFLDDSGTPHYMVNHGEKTVIDTSSMSFDFKDQTSLKEGFTIKNSTKQKFRETWEMPWGEQKEVLNHYEELVVNLEETRAPHRKLNIHFRAYDDGIGFRYVFPKQDGVEQIIITDENTQFQLTDDHMSWWTPGNWDTYEHIIQTSKISEIDAKPLSDNNAFGNVIPENAVHTPFTMRTQDGIHISIHEANLTNYSGMTLKIEEDKDNALVSELVGSDRLKCKAVCQLPFNTPWRTIQIGDRATDLIDSRLIVNLNEPNEIGNISWFKPQKYVGIWWEMHIGKASWDYENTKNGGVHGATTENAKRYIDFAAEHGFSGVLVEGWNEGWHNWFQKEDREGMFDFVTSYPDYNLEEVAAYGKEKGIQLIMHNETAAAVRTYEEQLDTAYSLMKRLGIHAVKTGYVKNILTDGEYHHGQYMVNHYRKVLKKAAENMVAVNVHEPIKATGIRRTYPNAISREGARGQEFNAWASDGGNPAEHVSLLAFTRLLAGPMDFTPGVFDISLPSKEKNQINTTIAHQLALYVVIYSPVQMACDLPENYENEPALQFIKDVGVDWEKSLALDGEVGDFITMARKERETGHWFIGGITDEKSREVTINFDFLEEGKTYNARIYRDAESADYKNNPKALDIEEIEVDQTKVKTITMANGGGFAISLMEI